MKFKNRRYKMVLQGVRAGAEIEDHWVRLPLNQSALDAHKVVSKELNPQDSLTGGDFALRATWLSFDALIVNPILAFAFIVEGVFRAFAGLLALGVSLIPFDGNDDAKEIGI